jgi:large subunit ribosomal protein L5
MTNPMRTIRIEKLTLNIGTGKEQKVMDRAVKLLKAITGIDPVKTKTTKRLQAWGLRPGLPIGCKITIRDPEHIKKLLPRLLEAKEFVMTTRMFDNRGNVSFGIPECIDIADYKYDPEIGIMGLQASVTLGRPGFRVKRRRLHAASVKNSHLISQDEAISFMKEQFNIKLQEEIEE